VSWAVRKDLVGRAVLPVQRGDEASCVHFVPLLAEKFPDSGLVSLTITLISPGPDRRSRVYIYCHG
jgi:hypothetical protein